MLLLVITISGFVFSVNGCINVNVSTTSGNLAGCLISSGNTTWTQYLGIPYAEPPIGSRRFEKPQAVKAWSGIRNATQIGKSCIQFPFLNIPSGIPKEDQSEDCLLLNVVVPQSKDSLAVMVYIYGGGFQGGSSTDYVKLVPLPLQGEVIMVTINYRLGPLGFLSTGSSIVPGNMALWDAVEALRWVKANIASFGGDPNRITVFGESAGSIMVSILTLSPVVDEGLFHRAIMQSGMTQTLVPKSDSAKAAREFGSALGCTGIMKNIIKCLQKLPVEKLLTAPFTATPVEDGDILPLGTCALTANSSTGITDKHANYDLLMGHNSQEGLLYTPILNDLNIKLSGQNISSGASIKAFNTAFQEFYGNAENGGYDILASIIRVFYEEQNYGNSLINRTTAEKRLLWFTESIGDRFFVWPTLQSAKLHSQKVQEAGTNKKTYLYEYDYRRPDELKANWWEGPDWLRTGADHADELSMVFGVPSIIGATGEVLQLSNTLIKIWSDFAKTGNPSSNTTAKQWPEFHYPNADYVRINGSGINPVSNPFDKFYELWTAIIYSICNDNPTHMPTPVHVETTTNQPSNAARSAGTITLTATAIILLGILIM